ncbi:11537_t:CDS:2, partial [Gigaspora rosea]
KLQYIDDPNQIPTEYRTPNICTLCKTDISLKFSESLADDNSMNNEQEVLTANTLMSLSYLSNTEVTASGQTNQPNSESGQANQLNSESGLANQLNLESGQANQQNSKSGQANQPNSEYDKANKLKMSRK